MLVLLLDAQTNQYWVTVISSLILQFFDTGEKR